MYYALPATDNYATYSIYRYLRRRTTKRLVHLKLSRRRSSKDQRSRLIGRSGRELCGVCPIIAFHTVPLIPIVATLAFQFSFNSRIG